MHEIRWQYRRIFSSLGAKHHKWAYAIAWCLSVCLCVCLVLNKENGDDSKASFLDLLIEKEDKIFSTKLYDKRDSYGFDIVCYPDLNGNIPAGPAYGVFKGQMVRIARNCSKFTSFQDRVKSMIGIMKKKKYGVKRLMSSADGCIRKYRDLFLKFSLPFAEIVNRLFWLQDLILGIIL